MLFKKYHIVVFKDKRGSCSKLQLRGWTLFTLILILAGLTAGNVFLLRYYYSHERLQRDLELSERTLQEQKTQLLSLSQKITSLQKNLTRIRDFDSKLRVMINLDQDNAQAMTAKGGSVTTDFSKGYLPLHRHELLARKMHGFLEQLNVDAKLEEVRQQDVLLKIESNSGILLSTPSVWPTDGWVTSSFGNRKSPFTGQEEFHRGLDISAARGTPVYAPASGRVVAADKDGSNGLTMVLAHSPSLTTRYAHLQRFAVKAGDVVKRGDLIAYVGDTGRSTGPHLHYEVLLAGVPQNPLHYILN
ncbi:MAG: M23 family metallopeptidase [Desulfovibrio aminophilus]|jgi:murein DD-endopeptidase MepM/ murein hydrolase activator NlpD|uniref:M23 family metallopeptidase n=1 Tax=Desulfovibrio aminophilus TaxID=81425 RepID=UPI0003FE2914|nr:M23 family metallopeptidase [Desulfovibrio aminophilus]MDY0306238.1 M23 family metallopeptidase [Desulfovibrionaceae bacterium]